MAMDGQDCVLHLDGSWLQSPYANRVQEHPQHSLTRQEGEIGSGKNVGRSFPPNGASYASVLRSLACSMAESGFALEVGKNWDTGNR